MHNENLDLGLILMFTVMGMLMTFFHAQESMDYHRAKFDLVCQCEDLYARNFTSNKITFEEGLDQGIYDKYNLAICFKTRTPVLIETIRQIKSKNIPGATSSPSMRKMKLDELLSKSKTKSSPLYHEAFEQMMEYLVGHHTRQSYSRPVAISEILWDT